MEFPTLYKQTATGAINRWTILVESNYYWTEFGKVDGVLQTSDRTYCEAKNIGRSNETTSDQQAVLEASSVWKKKRDRDGFVMSLDELQELVFDPPMLAKKFDGNYKKEMKFIQPKLDGIRCNISCNTGEIQSLSRHNMAFNTTKHIEDELKELLESNKHLHLDGELYNHDLHDDFNKIVSLCGIKTAKASNAQSPDRRAQKFLNEGDVVAAAEIYAANGSMLERRIKMLLSRANPQEAVKILDMIPDVIERIKEGKEGKMTEEEVVEILDNAQDA